MAQIIDTYVKVAKTYQGFSFDMITIHMEYNATILAQFLLLLVYRKHHLLRRLLLLETHKPAQKQHFIWPNISPRLRFWPVRISSPRNPIAYIITLHFNCIGRNSASSTIAWMQWHRKSNLVSSHFRMRQARIIPLCDSVVTCREM